MEHLKDASLVYAQALPANIRQGWKGLPGTNVLAYFEKSSVTAVKRFITLAPGLLRRRGRQEAAEREVRRHRSRHVEGMRHRGLVSIL